MNLELDYLKMDNFIVNKELDFLDLDLGLEINTTNFIKWLEVENEEICELETYQDKVGNMCEFGCLYLAMKYRLKPEENNFKLVWGKYGFWEHYWMEYTQNGKVYILDLTLKQFVPDAPELAITERKYQPDGYNVCNVVDYGVTLKEYCDDKKAFMFYSHPMKYD